MKKVILSIAAVIAAALTMNAQVKQYSFDLTPFNSIEVSNDFEVSVVNGDVYSALLSVDEPYRDYVTCGVNGSVLKVSLDEKKVPSEVKKLYKGKGAVPPTFRVTVTMPDRLQAVKLSGKAVFFEARDVMSHDDVTITLTDNAVVKTMDLEARDVFVNVEKKAYANLAITCDKLSVNAAGSSTVTINQKVKTTDCKVQGASNVTISGSTEALGFNIKGNNAKATLSGQAVNAEYNIGGSANVNASALECDNAVVKMNSICTLNQAASKNLSVDLSGGATLIFSGDPIVRVENIKASTMTRGK